MATDAARREPYIGEKRNFLRNGYGVYVYENQFFRYEGEWKNGKKHGHGKLVMKDGTYYEGQFINGEINGHGFKYFSSSDCKYTGQFLNGEMHGHGVMQYKDQSIYEGQWVKNKKQGFGVLRTSPKAVYEGNFEGHYRNGEGTQTYDNGDRYEGYWVKDRRHGHGELFAADGSYYVGQFVDDLFHGDGKMQHSSGMLYVGQWLHGFPSRLATKMVLVDVETPLVIRQGQPFTIMIKCLDDDDNEVVEDQGREIQISAGFKYFPPKQGSMLFDMIEDVEEKPIPTPFGYEVVAYPLTDQLAEEQVVVEEGKGDRSDDKGDGEGEGEGGEAEMEEESREPTTISGDEPAPASEAPAAPDAAPPAQSGSQPTSPSQEQNPDGAPAPETARPATPVEATPLPPPVATKRTEGGIVQWSNLQLSPPPPMYRPFVAMEEENKKNKKMSLKEKYESTVVNRPDKSDGREATDALKENRSRQVLAVPVKKVSGGSKGEPRGSKGGRPRSASSVGRGNRSSSKFGQMSTATVDQLTGGCVAADVKDGDEQDKNADRKNSNAKLDAKEKTVVADERFARTGEYVLMVHDVTTPPFLGKRLDPIFLLLKLKRPKKIIVKKPKWDTQRHIAAAMQARLSSYQPS